MIYLYVTPSGSVNLIEGDKMPVKPRYCSLAEKCIYPEISCQCYRESLAYKTTLEAAKASSVPVDGQERAKDFLWRNDPDIHNPISLYNWFEKIAKRDHFYGPFDIGYEIKSTCCRGEGSISSCELDCDAYCSKYSDKSKKVAILLPEKEPELDFVNPLFIKKLDEASPLLKLAAERYSQINYSGAKTSEHSMEVAKHSFIRGFNFANGNRNEPVGKLEEKEIKPGEPFTVDGRRYVIVNTSSASESSNLENGQNIFILKSVGSL